jgi:hypothetical protein
MGLLSGQNSNAKKPNNPGLSVATAVPDLLSGQNSNANQPNNGGIMGLLSGHNSNPVQPSAGMLAAPTGSGKPSVMAKGYPS